jgi:hypothetical protein
MPGLSIVQVQLSDAIKDSKKEFSDINLKLNALSLPQGAGPIHFNSDFGDSAALMLTVASPVEDRTHIAVRGYGIQRKIEKARSERRGKLPGTAVTIVVGYPDAVPADAVERPVLLFVKEAQYKHVLVDPKLIRGPGFIAVDGFTTLDDASLLAFGRRFMQKARTNRKFIRIPGRRCWFMIPRRQRQCSPRIPETNTPTMKWITLRTCWRERFWGRRKFRALTVRESCRSRSIWTIRRSGWLPTGCNRRT